MKFKTLEVCRAMMAVVFVRFPCQPKAEFLDRAEEVTKFCGGEGVNVTGLEKVVIQGATVGTREGGGVDGGNEFSRNSAKSSSSVPGICKPVRNQPSEAHASSPQKPKVNAAQGQIEDIHPSRENRAT